MSTEHNCCMTKAQATKLLGGTPSAAAEAIGITPQSYCQWPDILPARLADRVVAALVREKHPDDVALWFTPSGEPV